MVKRLVSTFHDHSATLLAVSRAIGETMIVLIAAGLLEFEASRRDKRNSDPELAVEATHHLDRGADDSAQCVVAAVLTCPAFQSHRRSGRRAHALPRNGHCVDPAAVIGDTAARAKHGADLVASLHKDHADLIPNVLAGTEETTTGVHRLYEMTAANTLSLPSPTLSPTTSLWLST